MFLGEERVKRGVRGGKKEPYSIGLYLVIHMTFLCVLALSSESI